MTDSDPFIRLKSLGFDPSERIRLGQLVYGAIQYDSSRFDPCLWTTQPISGGQLNLSSMGLTHADGPGLTRPGSPCFLPKSDRICRLGASRWTRHTLAKKNF